MNFLVAVIGEALERCRLDAKQTIGVDDDIEQFGRGQRFIRARLPSPSEGASVTVESPVTASKCPRTTSAPACG
ncbi:hypothetical protein IVB18_04985 [Bradyrhizobium sp. 186]|uniref:hypothetical protein n=1 Tax=Bradyrhizobium sp. 186 TaxID=2782654 RepID=UPI002001BED6|nr:hypothetical protein [Bradyrhizobium sp. 186]UPK36712.1 hypothetical protein IVB18_04985 [Bradyrhizobium sp. 186]